MKRLTGILPGGASLASLCGLHTSGDVARAQLCALKQRIPYLYAILTINVLAISYTHQRSEAVWQVLFLPLAVAVLLVTRAIWWLKLQPATLPERKIRRVLSSTVILSSVVATVILAWAVSLHNSDMGRTASSHISENGHVDFFVGITVISCIFLLMHLRLAAILVAITVVAPFSVYLLANGRPIETAIALNLLLVTVAMLYVAVVFSIDFERMVTTASDLNRLSSQNARLAISDALTDLPNRRYFFQQLEYLGSNSLPFAVIVLDLDGFKQVNDVYGHNGGDEVLRVVASRLRNLAPPEAFVARLGGDEFACLLTTGHVEAAQATAQAFIAACSLPVVCRAFTANIGASAGICLSASHADTPVMIYERADYALFQAKRGGRGRVESFSFEHDQLIRRTSRIAHLLRSADLCDELRAVYQPIFSANERRIISFEALIRWDSRELGPIGPDEFIPIAEQTDRIFDITRHMLRTALLEAASWPERVSIKVNLSVRDLMSPAQTKALVAILEQAPVHPSRVTLEVTETILAESLELVRSHVDMLRKTGCEIAVDDFGIGYSNLNYIHALSPDFIKIDRCFVEAMTNQTSQRIIRTIIELARNVGAKSVAEGVETATQAALLTEFGCDELQGYYFSKPVSAEAAAQLLGQAFIERNVPCFTSGAQAA